jgi:hypothetical protein
MEAVNDCWTGLISLVVTHDGRYVALFALDLDQPGEVLRL